MITIGGFIIGCLIFGVGFLMIWKSYGWEQNVGNLGDILGYPQYTWLDWNLLGVVLMVLGVIVAFGLLQLFFALTLGKIFAPGLRGL